MFDLVYLRRYLCDPGVLWTDDYLSALAKEGEEKIALLVNCIVDRFALQVFEGIPNYTLPDSVIGIRRITWKGMKLDFLTPLQWRQMFPFSGGYSTEGAFESSAFAIHAFQTAGMFTDTSHMGKPQFYGFQGSNREMVSLFPTPNESVMISPGDLYDSEIIGENVIVECYRLSDDTHTIPKFARRQLVKNYVMWKAFLKEGDSQNIKVAKYFEQKFAFGLTMFRASHNRIFSSKRRVLEDQIGASYYEVGKPQLPLNLQYTE